MKQSTSNVYDPEITKAETLKASLRRKPIKDIKAQKQCYHSIEIKDGKVVQDAEADYTVAKSLTNLERKARKRITVSGHW